MNAKKIISYISGMSGIAVEVYSFFLIVIIGGIDFFTGPDISLSFFYLIPILLMTWKRGKNKGLLLSVIAAAVWISADIASRTLYTHPVIHAWNTFIRLSFFVLFSVLLSRIKLALEKEREMSRLDFLTGIANTRSFFETARREINRLKRYNHPFSVAYIDIDNFKEVNDIKGHLTGDRLLKLTASIIQEHIRITDTVARLGGDEFVILFPEIIEEQSKVVIDKIMEMLIHSMKEGDFPVTFSIGVMNFQIPPFSVDDMIKAADSLMYSVKKSGKNSVKYGTFSDGKKN